MSENIDFAFQKAFDKISNLKIKLPPDVMLKFYGLYKQATFGDKPSVKTSSNVINAFKLNAWIQLNGMSKENAKQEYIKLADEF